MTVPSIWNTLTAISLYRKSATHTEDLFGLVGQILKGHVLANFMTCRFHSRCLALRPPRHSRQLIRRTDFIWYTEEPTVHHLDQRYL